MKLQLEEAEIVHFLAIEDKDSKEFLTHFHGGPDINNSDPSPSPSRRGSSNSKNKNNKNNKSPGGSSLSKSKSLSKLKLKTSKTKYHINLPRTYNDNDIGNVNNASTHHNNNNNNPNNKNNHNNSKKFKKKTPSKTNGKAKTSVGGGTHASSSSHGISGQSSEKQVLQDRLRKRIEREPMGAADPLGPAFPGVKVGPANWRKTIDRSVQEKTFLNTSRSIPDLLSSVYAGPAQLDLKSLKHSGVAIGNLVTTL